MELGSASSEMPLNAFKRGCDLNISLLQKINWGMERIQVRRPVRKSS